MSWNETFRRLLVEIEDRVDSFVGPIRTADRPIIVPYRGYGTSRRVRIRGRVIDDPGIPSADPAGSWSGHLRETFLRFASREIAGAHVELRASGIAKRTTTDSEGYFDVELDPRLETGSTDNWHPYEARLIDPVPDGSEPAFGSFLVPADSASFGIISDIDDTVIESSATSRFRMLQKLLLHNARSRLPFEGIASVFEELQDDGRGGSNPLFYVSSSPWNLYDFLEELFEIHGLPVGPMMLQDYGLDDTRLIHASHDQHKLEQIARIVGTYPDLDWVLVGDSGQKDPEIYAAVAEEFPARIRAILIRDVTTDERDTMVRQVLAPLEAKGVPVALVRTADEARTFSHEAGLIASSVGVRPR